MKGRFILAALVIALAAVAPSAAAPPAGFSVTLERQATFVAPSTIIVRVQAECPRGSAATVFVGVSQQQVVGANTEGFGFTDIVCEGSRQTVVVTVGGGPFTPGEAFAGAQGFGVTAFDQHQRVIDIS